MAVLRVKIWKNVNGAGSRGEWSNTHEISTNAATDSQEVATQVRELAIAESKFHLSTVVFSRATVSTFVSERKQGLEDDSSEVPLGFVGQVVDAPAAGAEQRLLPGEIVIKVKRKAGKRAGLMSYRHCIATQDWVGTGDGVKLTEAKFNQVQNAFGTYMANLNATMPLVKGKAKTVDGLPFKAVTQIICVGTGNRQLDARRKKKQDPKGTGATVEDKQVSIVRSAATDIASKVLPKILGAPGVMEPSAPKYRASINIENALIEAVNVFRALTGAPSIPTRELPALPPAQ